MAMSEDHIKEVLDKPAVVCCRIEEGTVIGAANLEDPGIFPDLEDSNLLTITSDVLTVEQVLGKKLLKTVDSLTPLTGDLLEGGATAVAKKESKPSTSVDTSGFAVSKLNKKAGDVIQESDLESSANFDKLKDSNLVDFSNALKVQDVLGKTLVQDVPALTAFTNAHFGISAPTTQAVSYSGGGILKIKIGEGKNIDIELPLSGYHAGGETIATVLPSSTSTTVSGATTASAAVSKEPKKMRSLTKKYFAIDKVEFGKETKIEGTTLTIRKDVGKNVNKANHLVTKMEVEIVTPDKYNTYSETIMDVQPIATKEGESKVGEGVTRVLDGVIMMVTGTDENGVQVGEFGSSEGILEENIMWNRPGAPDHGDIIIKTQVTIKAGTNMERPGPLAAHTVTDILTQEIRLALKELDEKFVVKTEDFEQVRNYGKKKIVVVKEIMGQGAMHDNLILPVEPVGILGGKPNVDLGNLPIMLSPLEVLDGGIHALTCIGPASKECSRHYFREPLVLEAMSDPEVDLCGIIFVGSPQINNEKFYVSERLGMTVEAMDVDGAIVTTEGFGNNHIDFASHVEQISMRGVPTVAMSFCAVQGALVVGNKYMKYLVDLNKSEEGIENEILECNTLCPEDAIRALAMLKSVMNGEEVTEAERKWNPNVKENNLEIVEKARNSKIDRVSTI